MNFEALNWLINSILNWFKCGHCKSKVDKKNIDVKSVDGDSVVLDIFCENCKNHSMLKTEVISVDLTKHLTKEQLEVFKLAFEKNFERENFAKNISDEQIKKLNKELKKENFWVSDLFNQKNKDTL